MARNGDPEIKAMNAVSAAMNSLDEPTRSRVLAWVVDKWGKGVFQFASFSVERTAESPTEPLPPVGMAVLGKDQRRG